MPYRFHVFLWFLVRAAAGLVVAAALGGHAPAHAQDHVPVELTASGEDAGAPSTPDRRRELLEMLRDDQQRETFLEQLEALIAADEAVDAEAEDTGPAEPAVVVGFLREWLNRFEEVTVDIPELAEWTADQFTNPFARRYWRQLAMFFSMVIGAGLAGFWLTQILLRRPVAAVLARPRQTWLGRMRAVIVASVLRAVPIAVFAVGALAALVALGVEEPGAEAATVATMRDAFAVLALALIQSLVVGFAVVLAFWVLLMPTAAPLRPLSVADDEARYLYRFCRRFVLIVAASAPVFRHQDLVRIPETLLGAIERVIALVLAILVIRLIVKWRAPTAVWLRGRPGKPRDTGEASPLAAVRQLLANTWHIIAILYVIAAYLIWSLNVAGGFWLLVRGAVVTALLLLAMQPVARRLGTLLRRQIDAIDDYIDSPGLARRTKRYQRWAGPVAQGLVYALGIYAIFLAWGVDLRDWVRAVLGDRGAASLDEILIILAVTFVLWEAVGTIIDNYLHKTDEAGARIERSGRAKTLLPLLQTAVFTVTGIVLIMMILSGLGVDIGPLLATAGIFGIAIGFGAQKLVQDIITGMFILIQDTIAVGDFVDVAGHSGIVESINVRTLALRDLEGTLHTIPFSEVTSVSNYTKEFAFALLDIGVAYRENVDEVMEVIRQVGAELEADPQYGQFVMDPIEIMGLDQLADSAVTIRARIRTKPMRQWAVRREYQRRLKQRFDELDIEIPFPHQTVYFGKSKAETEAVAAPAAQPLAKPSPADTRGGEANPLYPQRPDRDG